MNRTITMNLNGIIFHIEENAYDKLNKYLAAIKSYFKDSDGRDEIMNDIEARVAEMLHEKVSAAKQAVLMMDIESVIEIMGKPEDFAGDNEQQKESHSSANSFSENSARRKRVFRDMDEKKLGGVCAGIANYFDFDPIWLRAAFAISFFVYGSGFLLYLILWIIIPEARTTAEKLEMHGEKVDVNNISKAVNEEFESFKKRMKDFGAEMGSQENKDRVRSSAGRAVDFAGDILHNMLGVAGKIAAAIIVFFGVIFLIALLAALFGNGNIGVFDSPESTIHFSLYEFSSAILPSNLPVSMVIGAIILFIGIPLLSIIYGGIKYLFGIRTKNKIVKYTANSLWLCGLLLICYIGIMIAKDFGEQASNKQNIELTQPSGSTLYLDVNPAAANDLDVTYHHGRKLNFGDWTVISKDDEKFRIGYPEMNIVPAETGSFELTVIKTARGADKKDAASRAKSIEYTLSQTDSTILFNSFFDINIDNKLRGQDLKLILKVPVNKIIFLSKQMEKIIYDIDNTNDILDSDMVNRRWIMTKAGLKCIDCMGLDVPETDKGQLPPPPPPAPGVSTTY